MITPAMIIEACDKVETLCNAASPGPWTLYSVSARSTEDAGCIVTDEAGNELFDTFNRGHKVSLFENVSSFEDDGDSEADSGWIDIAGRKDLRVAAASRSLLPAMLPAMRALANHVHLFGGVLQDNELLEGARPFVEAVAALEEL